jgi:2-polyprenyl-3-methyl-5-hydroxy-6-metoxy-1,4-benzoquinol methylase
MVSDYRAEMFQTYQLGNEHLDEAAYRDKIEYFRHRLAAFLPADKKARIIDLACGAGEFLSLLHSLGYTEARGIDLSEAQLAHARRMGLSNVDRDDLVHHLESHPNTYDVVVLSHVIEHLTKNELLSCMRLVRAALKPGGRALFLTPNAASPLGFIYAVSDFTHELLLSATSLSQVAGAAALEVVYLGGARPNPKNLKGIAKAAAWAVLRPALVRVYGDRRLPYGGVVEPELLGVFQRPA